MKKIMVAALVAAFGITGCKSIEVCRRGHQVALDGAGQVVKDKEGNPVLLDMGWSVDYFQHWNWQKFDSMRAKAGQAELDINGYSSGADSNLVALVSTSFDGAARITEKVISAIITCGGSVAAEGGSAAIVALANKFIAAGGDESKATVTCKDGSCTVTDGRVTCTEDGCIDCQIPAQD